jgi:outer membrane protein TolC
LHEPQLRASGLPRILFLPCATLLVLLGIARAGLGEEPVTLPAAIGEALAANARLPLSAIELSLAGEREKEARAERWLKLAVEGDFIYAPPGYSAAITNLGEARLQAAARQPIYAGGALDAAVAKAGAGLSSAHARYRMAQKDVELEVRGRFSELLQAESEIEIRRAGLDQLVAYRTLLRSRQASGQGVASDVLKTEVRIELEEAAVIESEQRADEARAALNDLMGRDPAAPLVLAPLPDPMPPGALDADSWQNAPDVEAARAVTRAADADVIIASAERRPKLLFSADAGFLTDDTTHLNSRFWDRFWRDAGYSFTLVFSWPVFDLGAAKAREAEARLGAEQARLQLESERRETRLSWEKARSARKRLYARIELLSRAVPDARDSYLEAESRYRGGTVTALEVLEAHSAALEAAVRLSEDVARYRVAEAAVIRWSTP